MPQYHPVRVIAKVQLMESLLKGGILLPRPSQATLLVKPGSPALAIAVSWNPVPSLEAWHEKEALWETGHSNYDSDTPRK